MKPDEKQADSLWAELVHKRYPTCLFSGTELELTDPCRGAVESHHIFGRTIHAIRWNVDMGCGLCSHHHQHSKVASPHNASAGFWNWFEIVQPDMVTAIRQLRIELYHQRINAEQALVNLRFLKG